MGEDSQTQFYCQTCGDPIKVQSGLPAWAHTKKDKTYRHEAKPRYTGQLDGNWYKQR